MHFGPLAFGFKFHWRYLYLYCTVHHRSNMTQAQVWKYFDLPVLVCGLLRNFNDPAAQEKSDDCWHTKNCWYVPRGREGDLSFRPWRVVRTLEGFRPCLCASALSVKQQGWFTKVCCFFCPFGWYCRRRRGDGIILLGLVLNFILALAVADNDPFFACEGLPYLILVPLPLNPCLDVNEVLLIG